MERDQAVEVTVTSESAFHALGLDDADDLAVRADLMSTISRIVKQRRLTDVEVGTLIDMDQPRVSALLHGKITKYSTDRLLKVLGDLGLDAEMRVAPARTTKGRAFVLDTFPE